MSFLAKIRQKIRMLDREKPLHACILRLIKLTDIYIYIYIYISNNFYMPKSNREKSFGET